MVIEALKAARDFIENDRQVLAESLTVNGEIVFEDDIDRGAMAEYVKVLCVIDGALKVAVRPDDHCEEHLDMVKGRTAPKLPRYEAVHDSVSGHCCFVATVWDTHKPLMIGGKHYESSGRFEFMPVCECFSIEEAKIVAAALNAAALQKGQS